jgi:uncharacterized protein
MKLFSIRKTIYISILLLFAISSCVPATSVVTPTSIPPIVATSAVAPTSIPPAVTAGSRTVTFTTADGAALEGKLSGSGDTAVIFSVMGNCKKGWEDMADLVAKNGMTALIYQWRGCRSPGSVDEEEIQKFVDDLRGAINFMRTQGITKIILAGASLGGSASAKLMVESQADGLIVIASPPAISQWSFEVESADLDSGVPKLFITAVSDKTVPADATRHLYDLAAEPKEWETYPGTAHGTDLFEGENGEELEQRILKFILDVRVKEK